MVGARNFRVLTGRNGRHRRKKHRLAGGVFFDA
jgi:hypothetical protein